MEKEGFEQGEYSIRKEVLSDYSYGVGSAALVLMIPRLIFW